MALIEELREAVVDGQAKLAAAKVTEGLEEGIEAGTLLREGLIHAMAQVGKLYEEGEIFVPEMLVAARAMTAALTVLKPHLVEEGVTSSGKVAIGTTQGDLHDIGKNLVAMMLEGSGYEIVDLGVDVPADKFIEAIRAAGSGTRCASSWAGPPSPSPTPMRSGRTATPRTPPVPCDS